MGDIVHNHNVRITPEGWVICMSNTTEHKSHWSLSDSVCKDSDVTAYASQDAKQCLDVKGLEATLCLLWAVQR